MIYCCGGYHTPHQTIILLPNDKYKNRKLELLICPNCGKLSAYLTQLNIKTNHYESFRPKRKKTAEFIEKIQREPWTYEKVSYGTKCKAGFVYGVNVQSKDGRTYQYAVDFNGTRKLVKVI